MERFSSRESVLLGYSPSRSFAEDPVAGSSSSTSSFSDAVVDFRDVFGGPPRRVSIQDGRYSFNSDGAEDALGRRGSDEASGIVERRRSPWGGLGIGEKPVFGGQRRKTSDEFFDDIFRGGSGSSDSAGSTVKKRDLYSSSVPDDGILMMPRSDNDAFGVAPQSSMPAKVGKVMEVPMFPSVSRSPQRSRENHPPSPNVPASKLTRHGSQGRGDLTSDSQVFYRQSPLSVEFSFANDGSVKVTKSGKGDGEEIVKQNSTIGDSLVNSNQFHFSIYKWASKGAPPMIPIRGGVNFRVRDKSFKKSLNDEGKLELDGENEQLASNLASLRDIELKESKTSSPYMKEKDDEQTSTMKSEFVLNEDLKPIVEEKEVTGHVPDSLVNSAKIVKDISNEFDYQEIRARSKSRTAADLVCKEIKEDEIKEDEITGTEKENQKSDLTSAVHENVGQADNQTTLEAGSKPKGTTIFSRIASFGSFIKKQDAKGTISDTNSDVDKTSVPSSPGESSRRRKVKEKVKEFVEMFNQDSSFKSKMDTEIQSQSSEWNDKNTNKADSGVSVGTKRTGKDIPKPKLDKKFESSNASDMVDKKTKRETRSTQVDKKKMSQNTSAKVEKDTWSLNAKKVISNITDGVVDGSIKSSAAPITDRKKETFESASDDKNIKTATKVKTDSSQAKKSSSRSANIFTDSNIAFQASPTEPIKEAYQNDSPLESKKPHPSISYKVDKNAESPNIFLKTDGYKKPEKRDSRKEPGTPVRKDTSSKQKDVSSPKTGSLPDIYQDANESLFDPIDAFEIKELTEELSNMSKMDEYQLALQESDAKIRQWSRGKEGNIRSLLSTLQHVLWPGSGWKPVALMDIIEASQVKRTYQRALLCLHPDKLQQKGAAEHQKYIAGKVFDILQESWNHFNTLTSL